MGHKLHEITKQLSTEEDIRETLKFLQEGNRLPLAKSKMLHKDGNWVDVEGTGSLVTMENEPFFLTIIRDISHTMQHQLDFENLVDILPTMVSINESDGSTSYYNKKWSEYTGLTQEELKNEGWTKVTHPDYLPIITEAWQEAVKEGRMFLCETRLRDGKGNYNKFIIRSNIIKDLFGNVSRWVSTVSSIEEVSKEGEQNTGLSRLVDSSVCAILGEDIDGNIISWNKSSEELFGWTKEEIVGQSTRVLCAEPQFQELKLINISIKAGEEVENFMTVRKRKDGKMIPIMLFSSPVKDDSGTLIGASTIFIILGNHPYGKSSAR